MQPFSCTFTGPVVVGIDGSEFAASAQCPETQ